ncbi:Uncharacterised protein [Mycobacteroides abscessus subsp. abscessus]|nr:Uncharacterised protein [Mycobacteroides abscessus subsp. abscessus]
MFGVDRHDLPGSGSLGDKRPTGHQGFLIGQGQSGSRLQRGQGRPQAEGADQRVEDHIGLGVLHQLGDGIRPAQNGDVEPRGGALVCHRDIGDPGFGDLLAQQLYVAPTGGQTNHFKALRVGGDDLKRLGTDRPGTAEKKDAADL